MNSPLPGDHARAELKSTRFGPVEWVVETGSTNADLMARADDPDVDGTVRVADFQSAGRGRRGRTWVTEPAAALMVSVLVRPGPLGLRPAQLGRLTMAFGVAAAEACRERYGADVALKWPNDLVARADDRKLAGILAESCTGQGGITAVVIGMGLNANGPLPPEVAPTAATLAELAGGGLAGGGLAGGGLAGDEVDREELLVAVLTRFDELLDVVSTPLVAVRYRQLSATLGRGVRVELQGGTLVAEAVDVDEDGHLLVDPGTGELVPVAAGDVVHLRPA